MASPSPKRKVEVSSCCCCALCCWCYRHQRPVLLRCCYRPRALLSPTPCFPQLPPRGQSAAALSSFSVREAALPRSGMSNKNTLYRALHDGRPVYSWC